MDWKILVGSLVAVMLTVGLVRLLRMGDARLDDCDDARALAEETTSGFVAQEAICCGEGGAALVAGADGDFVLLKRLGSQYSSRRLYAPVQARTDGASLFVASGDRWFGTVALTLADPDEATRWQSQLTASDRKLAA